MVPPLSERAMADVARAVAYIALGSNLGDRAAALAEARRGIDALPDTALLAESTVEETEPIGPVPQPAYLNQMVAISTALQPHALLVALLGIERAAGRTRDVRWGPRTLDCDIVRYMVRYVDVAVQDERLTLPHPELPNRDFWRRELAELEAMSLTSSDR